MSTTDLQVALSQVPNADPSINIAITNTSPSATYTVLTRDSPLDELLVQLGLLAITPAGASEKLEVHRIMVKRIWPPLTKEFVVLEPGKTVTKGISAFREPVVNITELKEKGSGKATLQASGRWAGVWEGAYGSWAEAEGATKFEGNFESNALEIDVV